MACSYLAKIQDPTPLLSRSGLSSSAPWSPPLWSPVSLCLVPKCTSTVRSTMIGVLLCITLFRTIAPMIPTVGEQIQSEHRFFSDGFTLLFFLPFLSPHSSFSAHHLIPLHFSQSGQMASSSASSLPPSSHDPPSTPASTQKQSSEHVWIPGQELAAKLVFGGMGCMIAVVFTNPVDVIKVRLQFQGEAVVATPHPAPPSPHSSSVSRILPSSQPQQPHLILTSGSHLSSAASTVVSNTIHRRDNALLAHKAPTAAASVAPPRPSTLFLHFERFSGTKVQGSSWQVLPRPSCAKEFTQRSALEATTSSRVSIVAWALPTFEAVKRPRRLSSSCPD